MDSVMESNTGTGASFRVLVFFLAIAAVACGLVSALRREIDAAPGDLRFQAIFGSVAGLKVGSPVRLAGVDVGRVADIGFVRREGKDAISVAMVVRAPYAPLVRKEASVSIDSLGVLGDKYIEIALAEPQKTSLRTGDVVPGTDPVSVGSTMKKLDGAVEDLSLISGFFKKVVQTTSGWKDAWERFKAKITEEE